MAEERRLHKGTCWERAIPCLRNLSFLSRPIKRTRRFKKPLRILPYIPVKGLMHDPMFGDPDWWFKVGPALTSSGISNGRSNKIYRCSDTFYFLRRWFLRRGFNPFIPRELNGPGFPGYSRETRRLPKDRVLQSFCRQ
jgi:hypothetical protein